MARQDLIVETFHRATFTQPISNLMLCSSIHVAGFGYGQWRWRLGQGEKLGMGSQKIRDRVGLGAGEGGIFERYIATKEHQ